MRTPICLLLWAVTLILVPSVKAQIAAAKPTTGEIVRRPLVIIVHAGSTPDSLTARQQVKLGDVGSAESVYTWPVNEARSKPFRDLEGQPQTNATGQPLELTRNKKGVISMDWSTARLSKDDPIDLSVTVNRPAALRPGIYRADIHAELKSDADVEGKRDELAKPRHLRWPVFVFVQGRLIRRFTYDDIKPRVGKPAALEIELQAIGCDLGEGRFQLDAVKSETDLQLALHVLLNQKNFQQEFIDPERVFYEDKFQGINKENWRLSAVTVSIKPQPIGIPIELTSARDKVTVPKLERHVIRVAAGDYYQTGVFQAKLEWPQAKEAPTQPKVDLEQTIRTTVLPGIRVFPRHAAQKEGIGLAVVADGGLPDKFQLKAAGPNNGELTIPVEEGTAASVAGQAAQRVFFGGFEATDASGIWNIGWPTKDKQAKLSKEDQQTYQKLEAQVVEPVSLNVCFQAEANLGTPLEVFASAEPIWWPAYTWNPEKATGWSYVRHKAVQFAADPNTLKFAKVRQLGWLEVLSDGRRIPYDPTTTKGPKVTIQSEEPAPPNAGPVWQIPNKGALVLGATVSLHPKDPPDAERHKQGTRDYVWCVVLTGQDVNNRPVARIIEFPIKVNVIDSWYYDRYVYGSLGGLLLLTGAVVGTNYIRGGKKKGAKGKATGKPATTGTGTDEDDYFSRGPSDSEPESGYDAPSSSKSGPAETSLPPADEPPPSAPPEFDSSGDAEDYFK